MDKDEPAAILGDLIRHKTLTDRALRIEIEVEPQSKPAFYKAFTGEGPVRVAVALVSDETYRVGLRGGAETPDIKYEKPDFKYAHYLHQYGFFRNPRVYTATGTDKMFLDWIRRQPSVVSGKFGAYNDQGEGRCEAAHVRRASNSGTGMKPEYSAVPLTPEEHRLQHQKGYAALGHEPDWFVKKSVECLEKWCKEVTRLEIDKDATSFSQIPINRFMEWFDGSDLEKEIPGAVRHVFEDYCAAR